LAVRLAQACPARGSRASIVTIAQIFRVSAMSVPLEKRHSFLVHISCQR
jgi:hypothetical protein